MTVTVTGFTAARMLEMEDATVVSGHIEGDNLILVTKDGTEVDAGDVRGIQGIPGPGYIICTSTTRPVSPNEGTPIYETNTKLTRIWNGTKWRCQERFVCTSSTRPTLVSGDEGVKIYETDTNSEWIWTGTSWINVAAPIICTSSTRPTGVPTGQTILETNTHRVYEWNGSVWVYQCGGTQPLYSARMYFAGSFFTAANGVEKRVPFDTVGFDYNSDATVGASAKYVTPIGGVYDVSGSVIFGYNNAPRQLGSLLIRVDGAEFKRVSNTWGSGLSTSDACGLEISDLIALGAGQEVWLGFTGSGDDSNGVQVTDAFMNIRRT